MKTARFEVLSQAEVERIDAASMEILAKTGLRVEYATARRLFREAGAEVDDASACVRLPEKLVRDAVARAPQLSAAHEQLGVALAILHELPDAVPQLEVAVRLDPSSASAHYHLARAYAEQQRFEQARTEVDRALARDPGNADARHLLEQLAGTR